MEFKAWQDAENLFIYTFVIMNKRSR